jgi:hypothetical protein
MFLMYAKISLFVFAYLDRRRKTLETGQHPAEPNLVYSRVFECVVAQIITEEYRAYPRAILALSSANTAQHQQQHPQHGLKAMAQHSNSISSNWE